MNSLLCSHEETVGFSFFSASAAAAFSHSCGGGWVCVCGGGLYGSFKSALPKLDSEK